MQQKTEKTSVYFVKETLDQLDELGAELKVNRSDVIRMAVLEFIERRANGGYSLSRLVEVAEYTQILLQHHVIHDDADKHEAIVSVLDERLIEHHGR